MITLYHKNLKATIATLGAELLTLEVDSKNLIWTIDTHFWDKTSPLLFPIVGRLIADSYTYNGQKYSMPRHGFARNYDFQIVEQTENSVQLQLESDATTKTMYPFDFKLLITYNLEDKGLKITYNVNNTTDGTLPFSIGAHPAFAVNGAFDAHKLVLDAPENLVTHHLVNEQFTGATTQMGNNTTEIPLDYALFEKDALVFKNLNSKSISLVAPDATQVKVHFEGFPYLGIWTKPNAPFFCIEPWCGLADAAGHDGTFENKEGIHFLLPNTSFQKSMFIEIGSAGEN